MVKKTNTTKKKSSVGVSKKVKPSVNKNSSKALNKNKKTTTKNKHDAQAERIGIALFQAIISGKKLPVAVTPPNKKTDTAKTKTKTPKAKTSDKSKTQTKKPAANNKKTKQQPDENSIMSMPNKKTKGLKATKATSSLVSRYGW